MYRKGIIRCLTSRLTVNKLNFNASNRSFCVTRQKLKYKQKGQHKTVKNDDQNNLSAIAELFLQSENFKTDIKQNNNVIFSQRNLTNTFDEENESDTELEEVTDSYMYTDEQDEMYIDEGNILDEAEGELEDFKEDVIAVQNLQLKDHVSIAEKTKEIKSGTPDPKVPMSDINCQGCGAHFHCKDASIPGYLPSERFTTLSKKQLRLSLCQRCNLMYNYNICLNVKSTEEEFKQLISTINDDHALILLIIDLTDIRNSLMPQLFRLIRRPGRPVYIVGNKIDSVPMDETGYMKRIRKILFDECEKAGLNPTGKNIKHVSLVSAKTGYGVENLISHLMVNWKYKGNVYLLGNTNVGKSTLFNALLQSDYCKSRAREIIHRATVSVWPGTTISTLKFPITNPKPWRMEMREKRLKHDKEAVQEERELQKSIVQKEEDLRSKWKSATLAGYLGVTDFQEDQKEILKYDIPSFEMKNQSLISNMGRDHILNLPEGIEFDDIPAKQANWLYDTPGVINNQQTINLMTPAELAALLPTEVVPPRVYLLKPNQTMFISGFGRIDYTEGHHLIFMTVHVTSNIKVHLMNTDEADDFYERWYGKERLKVPMGEPDRLDTIPSLTGREFYLQNYIGANKALADIQLSSIGWVSVTKDKDYPIRLRAYTPGGKGLYLREPALLPNIRTFRGKRIGGKQEYRVKPPKMSA